MLRTASFVPSDLDEDDFMFNPHGFAVVADMALPRLSVDELTEAKTASSLSGKTTGFHLVEMGVLSDRGLADYLAAHFGVPAIPLDGVDIDSAIVGLIPRELAVRWLVVPVNRVDETLVIALSDPSNLPAVDDVRRVTGLGVEVVLASPGEIQRALARLYP
jgi:type IV pilus assembly protein PilB